MSYDNQPALDPLMHGRVPAQALELEEAVLGAMMLDRDSMMSVMDFMKPEIFYLEKHQIIFSAMLFLFNNSQPVDMLTVTEQVKKSGNLDKIGGPLYIIELTNRVASAANIEYHARIVYEKFLLRSLDKIGTQTIREANEEQADAFDLIEEVEQSLYELSAGHTGGQSTKSLFDISDNVVAQAEKAMNNRENGGTSGVTSGIPAIDRETGGWQKSDLIIIAARPGMGKTAFAVNTAAYCAAVSGVPTAVFSLEMSKDQLVRRILAAQSMIDSRKITNGDLRVSDLILLQESAQKNQGLPLYIDDTAALTVSALRAKARRMKMKHNIGLIVVDYLQLMKSSDKTGNREQEVSRISQGLKMIAKELDIPVIALSQLSRAVETRGGAKRPQLSDLRESGSLEQDADMVSFLYRPEYYGIMEDENGVSTEGIAEFIIAKNRHGALVSVEMKFEDRFAKFSPMDAEPVQKAGSRKPDYAMPRSEEVWEEGPF